jgi:uncharacterized protein (DUF305 family)
MNKISLSLSLSLMIVAAIIGMGFGYYLTPSYQSTMYEKSMGLGTADRWLDQRYVNEMISHHLSAISLAEQAGEKSTRPEIKALAEEIKVNEPKLIAELYAFKKEWYQDTREVKPPVKINLGDAGESFDLRFLNALIAHHEQGIAMTNEVRGKSSRVEVLNNADAVETFLKTTKKQLESWRTLWYETEGQE